MILLQDQVSEYLSYCEKQKQLDAKTRKAYRIDLSQLVENLPKEKPEEISSKMLEEIFAVWHDTYKPKTVKRKIASAKAFFHWMEEQEFIEKNPFLKIHTKFREPKVLPKTIPEHTLEMFMQAMYDTYKQKKSKKVLRDIAVIETLFGTGMRISELCGLKNEDVNLVEGEILIHGKGRKERIIQIPDEQLLQLLRKYKEAYRTEIETTGFFFINNTGLPLRDQPVRYMIQKYADKAGIDQHMTPHMFRHTFATLLLDSDVNLRCIQEILGHSSVSTTEIYTHVSAAKQRQILTDHHPRKQLNITL